MSEVISTGAESLTLSGQAIGNASMYLPATSVSASSGHARNQSMVHLHCRTCTFSLSCTDIARRKAVGATCRRGPLSSLQALPPRVSHLKHDSKLKGGAIWGGEHPLIRPGNCWARRPKLAPTGLKHSMTCRRSRTRPRKKLYRLSGVSGTPARHTKL